MNKEDFARLIHADSFTEEDMQLIASLKEEYPWFALPRFFELKIQSQLGMQSSPENTASAAVYASDRKHLYEWINELSDHGRGTGINTASEIEFLDEKGSSETETSFEFMDEEEERMVTDADVVGVPEKDEADMEEPEIEMNGSVPSIEPIEEKDDEDPRENDSEELTEVEAENTSSETAEPVDLLLRDTFNEHQENTSKKSNGLIEKFLEKDPGVIKADKETTLEGDVSTHSIQEDDSFITDTLAKIYVKQGLHAKAIYAYERLSLKYPEKSAYFAAQIEKIKENTNR